MGDSNEQKSADAGPPFVPDHVLLWPIGHGSYGEVWLARNATSTLRAVKVVHRKRFDDERPYEREFAGLRNFEPISRAHEGLMDVLQVGRNDPLGFFYYVMELADDARSQNEASQGGIAGGSLGRGRGSNRQPDVSGEAAPSDTAAPSVPGSQHRMPEQTGQADPNGYQPCTLESRIRSEGRIPAAECARIASVLADALVHLHRHGLVHRDIKPSNIIFVQGVPKLADVGLVAKSDSARTFVGTEGFVPPEGPGTVQADIYSLGKCLYEMAMGKDRQTFPSPPTLLDQLPDREALLELNEVIGRACDPDSKRRYPDAVSMLAELGQVASGSSVRKQRARVRWNRRLRWVGAAMALSVLGLAVTTWFLVRKSLIVTKELSLNWTPSPPIVADFDNDGAEDLLKLNSKESDALTVLSASGTILRSGPLFLSGVRVVSADFAANLEDGQGSILFLSALGESGAQVIGFNGAWRVVQRLTHSEAQGAPHPASDVQHLTKLKAWSVGPPHSDTPLLLASLLTDHAESPAQPRRELLCYEYKTGAPIWHHPIASWVDGAGFVDLNHDGTMEVVAWTGATRNHCRLEDGTDDHHAYVFAFDLQGTNLWKSVVGDSFVHSEVFYSEPSGTSSSVLFVRVARYETVETNRVWFPLGRIDTLSGSGTAITNFATRSTALTALAADLDGDNHPEIVASDNSGFIYVLDRDLRPIRIRQVVEPLHSYVELRIVAVEDLDGDGRKEVVATSSQVHLLSTFTRMGAVATEQKREDTDNSVIVLDPQLNVISKLVVADLWETPTPFYATLLSRGSGRGKVIAIHADRVLLLRFGGRLHASDR